jgi:hypothetical protein
LSGTPRRQKLIFTTETFRYGEIKRIRNLRNGAVGLQIEWGLDAGDRRAAIVEFTQRPSKRMTEWTRLGRSSNKKGVRIDAGVVQTVSEKGGYRIEKYEFFPRD